MEHYDKFNLLPDETITDINSGLKLIQKRDGLTFGSDAYLLSAYVRKSPRARCADLGSGTGIISLLLLAKGKVARIDAVELQPDFAELITRNAEVNGFSERLRARCTDLRELDGSSLGATARHYCVESAVHEADGRAQLQRAAADSAARAVRRYRRLLPCAASRQLKHGGLFYTVWRPDRLACLSLGAVRVGTGAEAHDLCPLAARARALSRAVRVEEGRVGGDVCDAAAYHVRERSGREIHRRAQ